MNSTIVWENFFKPETRNAGQRYITKDKVTSSQPSDTEIQGYVKGSTAYKVSLKCDKVESPIIKADCNCSAAQKGNLCKHIWAVFVKTQKDHPDFLEEKNEIQKNHFNLNNLDDVKAKTSVNNKQSSQDNKTTFVKKSWQPSAEQIAKQEAFKAKQADYRKLQYQRQKLKLNQKKQQKKNQQNHNQSSAPRAVQTALLYFANNGFPLDEVLNSEEIRFAKKNLARIFHPDAGGTHDEALELNHHFEVLIKFIEK